jgi:hypothetical protein
MKCVPKMLVIGALLGTTIASPAFAKHPQPETSRAAAIHECNVLASPYALYVWGNWQLYVYRECMAKDGQVE